MQVWNSSSYCSNDLIYTCISEHIAFNIWDIYDEARRIAHYPLIGNQTAKREIGSAVASFTGTHVNSTSLASTLVLTPTPSADAPSQINYMIYCNNILAESTPRTLVSSKLLSMN